MTPRRPEGLEEHKPGTTSETEADTGEEGALAFLGEEMSSRLLGASPPSIASVRGWVRHAHEHLSGGGWGVGGGSQSRCPNVKPDGLEYLIKPGLHFFHPWRARTANTSFRGMQSSSEAQPRIAQR